jgi:hypothetical protein
MSCEVLEILGPQDTVECFQICQPDILEIVGTGPQGPAGSSFDPLPDRPTTLNEVIAGGVTLGLWP